MARILPDTPPITVPGEVLRVYRAFKALPNSVYVWHHLAPWQPGAPDFLALDEQGRALLVKVSSSPAKLAKTAAQMLLIADEKVPLGESENAVLGRFIAALELPGDQAVGALVVFPNIPEEALQVSRLARGAEDPSWAGKELLQADMGAWQGYFPAKPMDPLCLERLRQRFAPEIVVPTDMTVRPSEGRRLDAGLTDYLLDYDQELAVKSDLDLPARDQALTSDFKLNIINGVAGSGKTLILLYRLRLLYHFYPGKRFLVLTHNRPLNRDMESRFIRLEGSSPKNIEWRTFNGWCYRHQPKGQEWVEPLWYYQREELAQAACQKHLKDSAVTPAMLLSEIDWFKDQLPMKRDEYLTTDRRGRRFGLTAEQRGRVFDAMLTYQKALKEKNARDWGDVARGVWKAAEDGAMQWPKYDFILVDEAQFFATLWVQIILKILNPRNGHLFLVADPTQGFLGRGGSWRSLGLEARGRTHRLRTSYRTTREIMHFATLLYRLRLKDEKDEDILAPDMLNMPNGAFPQLLPLSSPQDEIARIANEAAAFVEQGLPKGHLLLLHAEGHGVNDLIQAIDARLGAGSALDPKDNYPGDHIRVTTLNAGAGLESPIVFLAGLRDLFEKEQSLRLSDEERETLIRDNTRKLYMAATRAGQRLVLTYAGELPEALETAFQMIEI